MNSQDAAQDDPGAAAIVAAIATLYHDEAGRVLATLIRLLGDFDLAEEALQDAFRAALERWPRDGIPDNPRAWFISTGRFKAIDTIRRQQRFATTLPELARQQESASTPYTGSDNDTIDDDRLRLIFTCCHPALPADARVALTLRAVCGLSTEAIAQAFLVPLATIAQRIVRAKARIREAAIPYTIPTRADLPARVAAVLQVIYLVFNEGYVASSGETLTRPDLSNEAIRLGRLFVQLHPDPETLGLLALMLFHDARRAARTDAHGDIVVLEAQDRRLWNRDQITEGMTLTRQAVATGQIGRFTIQAAIAAMHAAAPSADATNWPAIVSFYDQLLQLMPSPAVEINRAVALAMRDGPAAGLAQIDAILARGDLHSYHLAHAARADLYRRAGDTARARVSYQHALALATQAPERRLLQRRLDELPRD